MLVSSITRQSESWFDSRASFFSWRTLNLQEGKDEKASMEREFCFEQEPVCHCAKPLQRCHTGAPEDNSCIYHFTIDREMRIIESDL